MTRRPERAAGWDGIRAEVKIMRVPGADGIARTVEAEADLDLLAADIVAIPGVRAFVDYLRSVTINQLLGPKATDAELRHLEGQRYIVGLIERRAENGRQRKRQ